MARLASACLAALILSCAHAAPAEKPASTASTAPTSPPAATPAPAPAKSATLYERLGGLPAIEAVVDDFLARVSQDERINAGFAGSNVPKLRRRLVELVCSAAGGPCIYSGRDMKTAHAGLGITGAQFDALAGHLVAALDKFKVPEREKSELLSVVGPMKGDIVEEP
jgi:hemoglobin